MLGLIFPCHPLDPRQVDPDYAQERDAFRAAGHPTFLVDTDALAREEGTPIKVVPTLPDTPTPMLYRGWMLTYEAYARLDSRLNGGLVTSPELYVASHHLPRWYPALADLTMFSAWLPLPAAPLLLTPAGSAEAHAFFTKWQAAGRTRAFVKDYVKSVKTGQGSGVASLADLDRVLHDMLTYKGFIEGGWCCGNGWIWTPPVRSAPLCGKARSIGPMIKWTRP